MSTPQAKFCKVMAPENKQAECIQLVKSMLSLTDTKEIEEKMKQLTKLTDKPMEEIVDKLYEFCPICGEVGKHEH